MTEKLVIYHGNCFDGWTAAWVLKRFGGFGHAELHAGRYGDPPPDVTGKEVLIVDFSYPRATLLKMRARAASLRVLDHHATARADLEGLDFCTFDMGRSGAGLAWDLVAVPYDFNCESCGSWCPKEAADHVPGCFYSSRPPLVDVIEDRDLWRHRIPETAAIMAWVATQPFTLEAWDELRVTAPDELVRRGRHVQAYVDRYGENARAESRWEVIGGFVMPTINAPYMNCSEHVGGLLGQEGAQVAAGYFRRRDGKWQFSLRSTVDVDCSAIARKYGGGGHKQAAGFTVDVLPWEQDPELGTDSGSSSTNYLAENGSST